MRDPRINPVSGDVLAIGISQWRVTYADEKTASVLRMGSYSSMSIGSFRSFFKLASTVRYGDES